MREKTPQKLFICLCLTALILLSAAGCAGGKADGVFCLNYMVDVEPKVIDLDNIPYLINVTVTNLSDFEYSEGSRYAVEYYDGEDWIFVTSSFTYPAATRIKPGESLEMHAALLPVEYCQIDGYVRGKYRVRYDRWFGEFTIR